jgi:UDP-N-acetylglucosamine 2-epimerase (non-hydrolysing)/GDP/UDP-N,N'-diacetylbacillosamine 2-epimerase (hydrolysing)
MSGRKVCVVTGSRAEYGLLYWLMKEIQADPDLDLQLVATGMHLSPEFGLTYRVIEEDGFRIDQKVEMLLSSDTPVGVTKSMGLATIGFAEAFERLKPDILVLLGDRFEALAAAQAAMVARIPIAHLHGGETTEGVIDEAIRHAITKMAHFHFVAAEPYRRRVIQLGEQPERVLNVGAPGLDAINRTQLLTLSELEQALAFAAGNEFFLVTYHPTTLGPSPQEGLDSLLQALDAYPETKIILTKPNADPGNRGLISRLETYASQQPHRVYLSASLGQRLYLSAMAHASLVVGNSSSGLIEAPALRTASINIGSRQDGRLRASSVIDCEEACDAIVQAIAHGLSQPHQAACEAVVSPYGSGNTAKRIASFLSAANLDGVLRKKFHDWP